MRPRIRPDLDLSIFNHLQVLKTRNQIICMCSGFRYIKTHPASKSKLTLPVNHFCVQTDPVFSFFIQTSYPIALHTRLTMRYHIQVDSKLQLIFRRWSLSHIQVDEFCRVNILLTFSRVINKTKTSPPKIITSASYLDSI